MFPVHISPDITAFVGVRFNGAFFEGIVSVLQGPEPFRQELVCAGLRDTEEEALADAERDSEAPIDLWGTRCHSLGLPVSSMQHTRRRVGADRPHHRALAGANVARADVAARQATTHQLPDPHIQMNKPRCVRRLLHLQVGLLPDQFAQLSKAVVAGIEGRVVLADERTY